MTDSPCYCPDPLPTEHGLKCLKCGGEYPVVVKKKKRRKK